MARATARRAARHQAVASSRAYSRRGAKRKPYTYVFTSIRPRLQNFCAADAQRPPPHRPHLGYAGLAPQPTYLGRAGPKQLGRAVKASLICAKTFREHASVSAARAPVWCRRPLWLMLTRPCSGWSARAASRRGSSGVSFSCRR